jgi:hypothetical protein
VGSRAERPGGDVVAVEQSVHSDDAARSTALTAVATPRDRRGDVDDERTAVLPMGGGNGSHATTSSRHLEADAQVSPRLAALIARTVGGEVASSRAAGPFLLRWQTRCYVLRGRCNSEPAVTVRDPHLLAGAVDPVELRDRRLESGW